MVAGWFNAHAYSNFEIISTTELTARIDSIEQNNFPSFPGNNSNASELSKIAHATNGATLTVDESVEPLSLQHHVNELSNSKNANSPMPNISNETT